MGIEYRLRFTAPNVPTVTALLGQLPGARAEALPEPRYDLGSGPDASVWLEPDGVLFCDHCGGGGRRVLGELVAALAAAFGPVTVEEL